jgi:hypothetical protein
MWLDDKRLSSTQFKQNFNEGRALDRLAQELHCFGSFLWTGHAPAAQPPLRPAGDRRMTAAEFRAWLDQHYPATTSPAVRVKTAAAHSPPPGSVSAFAPSSANEMANSQALLATRF